MFFAISGWLILSIVVGAVANNVGRSFGSYFLLSLFLSPILGFIILMINGRATKDEIFDNTPHIFYCAQCDSVFSGYQLKSSVCPECGSVLTETSIIRTDWHTFTEEKRQNLKGVSRKDNI